MNKLSLVFFLSGVFLLVQPKAAWAAISSPPDDGTCQALIASWDACRLEKQDEEARELERVQLALEPSQEGATAVRLTEYEKSNSDKDRPSTERLYLLDGRTRAYPDPTQIYETVLHLKATCNKGVLRLKGKAVIEEIPDASVEMSYAIDSDDKLVISETFKAFVVFKKTIATKCSRQAQ